MALQDESEMEHVPSIKPTIIGLYAISGSGKSHIMNNLKTDPALASFSFYDGSEMLDRVTPGGLIAFRQLGEDGKKLYRDDALARITKECQDSNKTGVVAGHYMFWNPELSPKEKIIDVEKDWDTYTHIVYLNVDAELVARRRRDDASRTRSDVAVEELRAWQAAERNTLREKCRERGVLFTSITEHASSISSVVLLRLKALLLNLQQGTETSNAAAVGEALDAALGNHNGVEKVLLLDADRTLAPRDTGAMFWKYLASHPDFANDPLKGLFKSMGYSYASFRQAALYYEEVADVFDTVCNEVAASVEMYPEMQELLARAAREPHIRAIVVTCGRAEIWEKVLARHNLSHVSVLGSSRLADNSYVITDILKSRIVRSLHAMRLRVLAFGDSPLDLPMLRSADKAYIVVDPAATRSTTMDNALSHALSSGLEVHQILLPPSSPPHLHPTTLTTLPIISLTPSTITTLFRRPFIHATPKPTALLLATPTRDAALSGPALRKAHERIGTYLAMEYLSSLIGLDTHSIAHVQGHSVAGHHLHCEAATLILPLMRGGEPMALGISKAFPRASFAHTRTYPDIAQANFAGKKTVIVVDSVVNTGASVVEFVRALRRDHADVRVIVVAGVVQAGAVTAGAFADMLEGDENLTVVALRTSGNRYKGVGGTDTGHRLFGTTYLA